MIGIIIDNVSGVMFVTTQLKSVTYDSTPLLTMQHMEGLDRLIAHALADSMGYTWRNVHYTVIHSRVYNRDIFTLNTLYSETSAKGHSTKGNSVYAKAKLSCPKTTTSLYFQCVCFQPQTFHCIYTYTYCYRHMHT